MFGRRAYKVLQLVECRMAGCRWRSHPEFEAAGALAQFDQHWQAVHPYQPIPTVPAKDLTDPSPFTLT